MINNNFKKAKLDLMAYFHNIDTLDGDYQAGTIQCIASLLQYFAGQRGYEKLVDELEMFKIKEMVKIKEIISYNKKKKKSTTKKKGVVN